MKELRKSYEKKSILTLSRIHKLQEYLRTKDYRQIETLIDKNVLDKLKKAMMKSNRERTLKERSISSD